MPRRKRVEIDVDEDLVDEVIRRYHVRSTREAVHLALRTLVGGDEAVDASLGEDEEEDPFGLDALRPHKSADSG